MPFNFGSLFSAVGRALPGWIEGERRANQDNWKDLENYNSVQAGQMQNAWTEDTWQYRLDNMRMNRDNNVLGLANNWMTTGLNIAAYPGLWRRGAALSANAGPVYDDYYRMLRGLYQRGINSGQGVPIDPAASLGLGGGTPSGLR